MRRRRRATTSGARVARVDSIPYRDRKLRRVRELQDAGNGHGVWIWDVANGGIPPLPPRTFPAR